MDFAANTTEEGKELILVNYAFVPQHLCPLLHPLSLDSTREEVPCSFRPSVYVIKPNYLLQFDYIEITASATGVKYTFMLRDNHSVYCWLFAFPDTFVDNADREILDWLTYFWSPQRSEVGRSYPFQ